MNNRKFIICTNQTDFSYRTMIKSVYTLNTLILKTEIINKNNNNKSLTEHMCTCLVNFSTRNWQTVKNLIRSHNNYKKSQKNSIILKKTISL